MEETKTPEILQSKRKTTTNIKNNNILILNSTNNKYNLLTDNNMDLDNFLDNYEELNGINIMDNYFKRKVKSRKNFISKIPLPKENCLINLGSKYKNLQSKIHMSV